MKQEFNTLNSCLIGLLIFLSGSLFASTTVTLMEDRQLSEILSEISEKYQVIITYDAGMLEGVKVNIEANELPDNFEAALNMVMEQTNLDYMNLGAKYYVIYKDTKRGKKDMRKLRRKIKQIQKIESSGKITLGRKQTASGIQALNVIRSIELLLQGIEVSGTVVDESGVPLIGVNIQVKGSNTGTATDLDGRFTLPDVEEDAVLVVSYIGYQTQEVPVEGRTSIQIILLTDSQLLEEVVVVGYGTQKKSDLTGAVSTVSGKDFENVPASRVDQVLQGKAPGVQVTQINGAPGTGSTIRIRGGNSIQGNNEPLYVIDGFIVGTGFNLNNINLNDIESIEVLKDASSISIYGTRGANGVIMITTKSGSGLAGKPRISLNTYSGLQVLNSDVDFANGPELAYLSNLDAENRGAALPFPNLSEVPDVDWVDELTRNAMMNNLDLSVSGQTTENTLRYYISGNYFNQEGIVKGSGIEKYLFRTNLDINPSERLTIGARLNFTYLKTENNKVNFGGLWKDQGLTAKAIYNEDGSYTSRNPVTGSTVRNAAADVALRQDHEYVTNFLGTAFLQYEPIDGLVLKTTFGPKINNFKRNRYFPGALPERLEVQSGGQAILNNSLGVDILNENTISYTHEINENHRFDILGGFTWQTFKDESFHSETEGFTNDVVKFNNLALGDPSRNVVNSNFNSWQLVSWLGRVNYNIHERILLTAVARVDGSSRFSGSNNQYGFFPSFAAAWRLIEEPWIRDMDVFDNLKLRASYGRSGSQAIGTYRTLSLLDPFNAFFNGIEQAGVRNGRPASPDLKWETTDQLDIGLETSFIGGRLAVELDYYHKKTKDLLLNVEIPTQTGFFTKLQNLGSVQNNGLELLVKSVNVASKEFTWETTLTIAGNRSKVLDIGDSEFINVVSPTQGGPSARLIVGHPVPVYTGVEYLGVWQSQEEIEQSGQQGQLVGGPKFRDTDGDGTITVNDFEVIGDPQPDFYGGLMNTVTWKAWSLDVYFNGSYGNDLYNLVSHESYFFREGSNAYRDLLDHWSPDNRDSDIPMPGTSQSLANIKSNTRMVEDGSYLRLKNVRLSYSIPAARLGSVNWLQGFSVYFSGGNLLLFSQNKLFDPEVSQYGTNNTQVGFTRGEYPYSTTYTLGIRADF